MQVSLPNSCWQDDHFSTQGGNISLKGDHLLSQSDHQLGQNDQLLSQSGHLSGQGDHLWSQSDHPPDWAGDEQVDDVSVGERDVTACNFEGTVYQEGHSWLPDVNSSNTTCSCSVRDSSFPSFYKYGEMRKHY